MQHAPPKRWRFEFGDLQRVLECRAIRASTAVLRESVAEADKGFAQLDELRGGGPNFWGTMFALLSLPHRARLHGDLAAARRAAEANNALAVGSGSAWFSCSTRLDVANFRLLTGDNEAAREPARTALAEATAMSADVLVYGAHLMIAATGADDEAAAMAEALRIADMRDYRFLMPYGVRLPQLDAALWRALGTDAGVRAAVLLESIGPASVAALRPLIPNLNEAAALRAVAVLRAFDAQGRDALGQVSGRIQPPGVGGGEGCARGARRRESARAVASRTGSASTSRAGPADEGDRRAACAHTGNRLDAHPADHEQDADVIARGARIARRPRRGRRQVADIPSRFEFFGTRRRVSRRHTRPHGRRTPERAKHARMPLAHVGGDA